MEIGQKIVRRIVMVAAVIPTLVTQPATAAMPEPSAAGIEDLSLEELMNVRVTTVSRQESTVGSSPAAVFVVTQEMIRRSGATSIPELFRMVPGMEVARIDSNKWAISIRGFNNRLANKLLVQIDGRTVYNPIYSGVYWDTVDYPLEDIERIEVVRGPGASVWGANAVNGIINIITKTAKDTQGTMAEAWAGNEERGGATVRYGGKSGTDRYYRAYAKAFDRDSAFHANGDDFDDWHGVQTGFRFDRPAAGKDAFTVQGDWFQVDSGQRNNNLDINNPPTFIRSDTADEDSNGGNLLARWTHDRNAHSNWALQAYFDRFSRTLQSGYARFHINTFDLDFQRQLNHGSRHRWVYGAGYRLQKIAFTGSTAIDNAVAIGPAQADLNRDVLSAFIQDEIKLHDRLTMTLGSKFENNDYTGFEYQPSARLLWTRSKTQSAWASVSRAVRTPSMLENDFTLTTVPLPGLMFFQLLPNTSLQSEVVVAHELGYRVQASANLNVDAALFYNTYDDLAGFSLGAPRPGPIAGSTSTPFIYNNGLDSHTYGIELASQWSPGRRCRISGAYTYLKEKLHADGSVPVAFRRPLEAAAGQNPRHQIYVRSSLDVRPDLQCDLTGRYVDTLPAFSPRVPSYVAVDLRLAWKPRQPWEVAIVGQNLFDKHHAELRNGAASAEMERGFYGKITYRW